MSRAPAPTLRCALVALGAVLVALLSASTSYAAPAGCTTEATSLSAAASQAKTAADGSVVCIAGGTYAGTLTLSGAHTSDVTVQPSPGSSVTIGLIDVTSSGSHYHIDWLTTTGSISVATNSSFVTVTNTVVNGVRLKAGSHDVVLDHNYITGTGGSGQGVSLESQNCESPNSPVYSGCGTMPVVANVTISNNTFRGPVGEDPIHASHYKNLTITGNDIGNYVENGNHQDAFQSVWGGSDLTFTKNYIHDVCGQGFFIKDGDVSNVVFDNNLIVRSTTCPKATSGEFPLDLVGVHNMQITRNTIWSTALSVILFGGSNGANSTGVYMHRNAIQTFQPDNSAVSYYSNKANLDEDENVIGGGWNWSESGKAGPHDRLTKTPGFPDAANDDWRLAPVTVAGTTYTPGVDWKPSDMSYGPQPAGSTPPPTPTPTAPTTTITSGPANLTTSAEATFTFTSSAADATFTCSLDGAIPSACSSPKSYTGLGVGAHTFTVAAKDPATSVSDASPAGWNWTTTALPVTPPVTPTPPLPPTPPITPTPPLPPTPPITPTPPLPPTPPATPKPPVTPTPGESGARLLLGSMRVMPSDHRIADGVGEAFQTTARASGTLRSLSIYVTGGSARRVIVGVYSSVDGHPGTLLTSGTLSSPGLRRWNSVDVRSLSVTAGRSYWIAIAAVGGDARFRNESSGSCRSETLRRSRASLPSGWGWSLRSSECPVSAFAADGATVPAAAAALRSTPRSRKSRSRTTARRAKS